MNRRFAVASAAAALGLVAAYANHFHNSFHFDDMHVVENNLAIRDLRSLPRFFADSRSFSALPSNQSYRPVLTTTLAVDWAVGGGDPFEYHLQSFAWFALECLLVFLLFRRVLGGAWAALFGAALFAFHAANAETVNYVVARGDVLSALGAVATVWLWAASPRARQWHLYLLPAVAGTLAKEQGAMAAPLLFAYLVVVERRPLRRAAVDSLPAFAACGAAALLAIRMAPQWVPGGSSRLLYALTQPWAIAHYAAMFLLPVQLSADSDWTVVSSAADWRVFAGFAFLGAVLLGAWRASRTESTRPIAFGLVWFLFALLPTSSVVPLAEAMNDHRMHFAFVGLALAAACAGRFFLERQRALATALAIAVLCAHAAGTWRRNRVWRTEESLWADVVEKSPGNARGWMNFGLTRMARGDYGAAESAFQRGLRLAPEYPYLHVNLAVVLGATGRSSQAEERFRRGIELGPRIPALRYFYAKSLDAWRRPVEAIAMLEEALALSPQDAASIELLRAIRTRRAPPQAEALLAESLVRYRRADYPAVLSACDAALTVHPAYAEAYNNRCAALNQLGRHAEAAADCESALRLKPEMELARNNLAVAASAARPR